MIPLQFLDDELFVFPLILSYFISFVIYVYVPLSVEIKFLSDVCLHISSVSNMIKAIVYLVELYKK